MEGNLIFFTTQWFMIQPDLFGRIEDELGELGESEKEFVQICTTALNSGRFEKYRWCDNGHPPSSRVAIFKMLVLKALRNFPTTKDTLLIIIVGDNPRIGRDRPQPVISSFRHLK